MFMMVEIEYLFYKNELNEVQGKTLGLRPIVRQQLDILQKIWNNGGIVPKRIEVRVAASDSGHDTIE